VIHALQGTYGGGQAGDAFVAKVAAGGGSFVYSTYLGGSGDDAGLAIATDAGGTADVAGQSASPTFPVTDAVQWGYNDAGPGCYYAPCGDAFVATLGPDGQAVGMSTFLGGSAADGATGIARDCAGNLDVGGYTQSADFPTASPAAQGSFAGGNGYDAFAARIGATRVITYAYDGVNRVTEAATCPGNDYQYAYDLAGNRTGETLNGALAQRLGYDAANEVLTATTAAGTALYGYDGAGNLLGDGTNTYSYDALSRLTALTPLSGTAPTESDGYNGDGVLVTQTVGGATTQYAQDLAAPAGQSQVLATTTGGSPAATSDYLYGSGDERLAGVSHGGVTRAWYGTDLQGSVRYTTDDGGNVGDGSAGNVGGPAGYDPYGAPEGTSAPAPFGYTGELQDPGTGLVNLRARTYNPPVGQFLTRDPLEQQTGQAYAYAGGDPVNNADPSGQDFFPQDNLSRGTDSFYDPLDSADQVPNSGLENITLGLTQDFVTRSAGYAVGPVTIQNHGHSSTVDVIDFNPHPQGGHIQAALYQFVRYSSGCSRVPGSPCAPSQDNPSNTSNARYLGRYDPSGDQTLAGALDEINAFRDQARKNPLGFPSAVERIIQRISPGSTCTQGTLDFTFGGYYPFPLVFTLAHENESQQPQNGRSVRSGIVLPSSSPGYNDYLVNARQHTENLYGGDGLVDFNATSNAFDNIVTYNVEGGKQDQSAITGYKYTFQQQAGCLATADQAVTCAGYVGTSLDALAFLLAWVPGGQPFAAALGVTAIAVNGVIAGYHAIRFGFDPAYRTDEHATGIALELGGLTVGLGGKLAIRLAERQATTALNAAVANHASKFAIETLVTHQENVETLGLYADSFFAYNVNAFNLVRTIQEAGLAGGETHNSPCIPCATNPSPPGPPYPPVSLLPQSGGRMGTLYVVVERKRGH